MSSFGLDYITGPPIDAMKAANVAFVCRYLSFVNPLTQVKLLTPAEAKTLGAAGIALVSNFEWYAARPLEGFTSGASDAHIAASQHTNCGGPSSAPIYFSVDTDVSGSQVLDYFKGVASVIGLARTGAYGSYRVLNYLFNVGAITWGWQTYAWSSVQTSNGQWVVQWEPRAHIQQYQNGAMLAGHSVDYNRSMQHDFGQWFPQGGTLPMSIDLSMPIVAAYFKQVDADHWLCIPTGRTIQFGNLVFYRSFGNSGLCGITHLGLPVSEEIPLDSHGNTRQHFENAVLFYDPQHIYDMRPGGSGPVYLAHIYTGQGQDPEITKLNSDLQQLQADLTTAQGQVAQLQAEIQKLQSQPPQPDPRISLFEHRLSVIESDAKTLIQTATDLATAASTPV